MRVCLLDEQLTFCYLSVSRSLHCLPNLSSVYLKCYHMNLIYLTDINSIPNCPIMALLVLWWHIQRSPGNERRTRACDWNKIDDEDLFPFELYILVQGCIEALKAEYGTNPGHSGSAYVHCAPSVLPSGILLLHLRFIQLGLCQISGLLYPFQTQKIKFFQCFTSYISRLQTAQLCLY